MDCNMYCSDTNCNCSGDFSGDFSGDCSSDSDICTDNVMDSSSSAAELANAAKAILESSVFRLSVENARNRIFSEWCNTTIEETAKRERLHADINALGRIIFELTTFVQNWQRMQRHIEDEATGFGIV